MDLEYTLEVELVRFGNALDWRVRTNQKSRANTRWCHLLKQERKEEKKSIQRKKICIFRYVGFEMFIGHSYRTVYYVLLPID